MTKNRVEQTKTLGETKERMENNLFSAPIICSNTKIVVAGRR